MRFETRHVLHDHFVSSAMINDKRCPSSVSPAALSALQLETLLRTVTLLGIPLQRHESRVDTTDDIIPIHRPLMRKKNEEPEALSW